METYVTLRYEEPRQKAVTVVVLLSFTLELRVPTP